MSDRLLTAQELAERWQVPLSWIYERSRHNALPGLIRLGKYLRFRACAVREFEEAGKNESNNEGAHDPRSLGG